MVNIYNVPCGQFPIGKHPSPPPEEECIPDGGTIDIPVPFIIRAKVPELEPPDIPENPGVPGDPDTPNIPDGPSVPGIPNNPGSPGPTLPFYDPSSIVVYDGSVEIHDGPPVNLFDESRSKVIDDIIRVHNTNSGPIPYIDTVDIEVISSSLSEKLLDTLFTFKISDNEVVPEEYIIESIRNTLAFGDLDNVEVSYLEADLKQNVDFQAQEVDQEFSIPKSGFGLAISALAEDRLIEDEDPDLEDVVLPNPSLGALEIFQNNVSVQPGACGDGSRELKETITGWSVVPTEINAKIPITCKGNMKGSIPITPGNQIPIVCKGNMKGFANMAPNINLNANGKGASKLQIPTQNDRSKAVATRTSTDKNAQYHIGNSLDTVLSVSAPPATEYSYDINAQLSSSYVLLIDSSSVAEVASPNTLISKYRAKYTLASSTGQVNEVVKFQGLPWKVITANFEDPIIEYVKDPNATIEATFSNVSLKSFGDDKIVASKLPKAILLLPTNKTQFNLYNGHSELVSWGVRQLTVTPTPDKLYSNSGFRYHWLKKEPAYPGDDVERNVNTQAVKFTYNPNADFFQSAYVNDVQPARRKHGFRQAVEVVSSLGQSYNLDGGVTWHDVLTRIDTRGKYTLNVGVTDEMITSLENGTETGIKIFHTITNGKLTRLIDLKEGQVDNTTTYF